MTYVGFTTKDIRERIEEHTRGITRTTAPHIPWQIEVVVMFVDSKKAKEFEQYLKTGSGKSLAYKRLIPVALAKDFVSGRKGSPKRNA